MRNREKYFDSRISVIVAAALCLLFVLALVASWWILRPSGSHVVEVVQDDEVLYTIDLDLAEDMDFTVFYEGGGSNTICIRDGQIRVSEAQCPDQTCVKMGKLRSDRLPIVCLPNHLIVRFVN